MAAVLGLLLVVVFQTASASTTVLIDGPDAHNRCLTSYPGVTGPDELSPCQWDMKAINAGGTQATGAGVKVGIIDSGIDFTHPDLAGAIDVGLSCSFINTNTPTANPAEVF